MSVSINNSFGAPPAYYPPPPPQYPPAPQEKKILNLILNIIGNNNNVEIGGGHGPECEHCKHNEGQGSDNNVDWDRLEQILEDIDSGEHNSGAPAGEDPWDRGDFIRSFVDNFDQPENYDDFNSSNTTKPGAKRKLKKLMTGLLLGLLAHKANGDI